MAKVRRFRVQYTYNAVDGLTDTVGLDADRVRISEKLIEFYAQDEDGEEYLTATFPIERICRVTEGA